MAGTDFTLGPTVPQPPTGQDQTYKPYVASGVSGLQTYGDGRIYEEFLVQLQGSQGRATYRQMADNDAVIGAILFSIEMLMRQVDWTITPYDDSAEAKAYATFVDECLHDMEDTWEDTLGSILSFLQFGWSFHEVIYKKRNGLNGTHSDGKVGWRGWYIRSQETLNNWLLEPNDWTPRAMVQLGPPDWKWHTIPLAKGLLFRTTAKKQNPEGRSILRNAYRSWYYRNKLQTFEGIGVERDLAGIPIVRVPVEVLLKQTPEDIAMFNAYSEMASNIKRDEYEGALLPSNTDEHGKYIYDIQLLTTGGTRQFDLNETIQRYSQEICMTVMADFITIGHEGKGSNTAVKSKAKLFTTGLLAYLDMICSQANDNAIPRLMRINGYKTDKCPKLTHGDIERSDIDLIGTFIFNLSQAGSTMDLRPGSALYNFLMKQAGLPEIKDQPIGLSPAETAAKQQAQAEAASNAQIEAAKHPALPPSGTGAQVQGPPPSGGKVPGKRPPNMPRRIPPPAA